MYQHKHLLATGIALFLIAVPTLADNGPLTGDAVDIAKAYNVNCENHQSLANAIERQKNSRKFFISGTCVEDRPVLVDRSRLELIGVGGASVVGGGIIVDGSLGASISGLGVSQVNGAGITVLHNSQVQIADVTVENSLFGLLLDSSTADVVNFTTEGNQAAGIFTQSSHLNLGGMIAIHNSGAVGLGVSSGSVLQSIDPGLVIESTGNGLGVVTQSNSVANLLGARLTASDNASHGIATIAQSVFLQGIEIVAQGNGGFGIAVIEASSWVTALNLPIPITVSGNTAGGVGSVFGSTVALPNPTVISDNSGPAVFIDQGKTIIENIDTTGNMAGIMFTFGTEATFGAGNNLGGPTVCDSTVLTRGTAGCDVQAVTTPGIAEQIQRSREMLQLQPARVSPH